jgi:hypothetical protein
VSECFAIDPERKATIVRYVRRAGLFLVPVIGLFFFVALFAWTLRRQHAPVGEGVVTPEVEPDYEVGPEVTPV